MKHDDESLKLIYNSASVFVTPSLAENLSNAIMESLSCGTPVVAFDIGGNADMINHKQNGYLANSIQDLAQGIAWVLDSAHYATLSQNARNKVLNAFSAPNIAQKYINQYAQILGFEALLENNEGGGQYDVILYVVAYFASYYFIPYCADNFSCSALPLKSCHSVCKFKKQEFTNFSHIFSRFSYFSYSRALSTHLDKSHAA